ncbi:MAG TPA: restriction endonuclease subunit S [Woeseiaceae bacterium]|nr:restriction endonuclease subunit S [Woeseiaceae bacterium]
MRERWPIKRLDQLCKIARGGSPRPIKLFLTDDHGGINWIKISDATASSKYIYKTKQKIKPEGIRRSRMVYEGDFLLSNSMSFGRPYIMRTSGCIHDGWLVLADISDLVDQDYLYHFLGSAEAYQQFDARAAGSTVRNLNIELVCSVEIPLPPLPEQKRIVAILDEAFAGIATAVASTEKNLANARELFESYLNSLFLRHAHIWTSRKLEQVCKKITVGHVGSMAKRYKPDGIPLLRSQNIRPFRVDLEKVVYIDKEFHSELKKSALRPGDLGIVRTGYPGTAAVIPDSLPIANCSDLVIVRPGDQVLSDFLAVVFNSTFGKQAVAGVLVGAAQKHFNVTAAKAALVPIPSIKEQERIVAETNDVREECEKLGASYEQKLTALAELKQSVLQKAFSGELTAGKETPNANLKEEEVA